MCSRRHSQNFFLRSLLLYTSCLLFVFLNEDIVDIGKLDGICLPTFVVNEFSLSFLYPSIFSTKYSRFPQTMLCNIFYIDKILIFQFLQKALQRYTKIFISAYLFMRFRFVSCCKRMIVIQKIKISVVFRSYL